MRMGARRSPRFACDCRFALFTAAFAIACGTPAAPTPSSPAGPQPFSGRVVLSGQSNATNLGPFLAVYGHVDTVAANSLAIARWDWTDPTINAVMWRLLEPVLHEGPVSAFVWWQGESDRDNWHYESDTVSLLAHVRVEAGAPVLPMLIVRVLPKPENAGVRAAQEQAAADLGALLVSIDDCEPDGTSDHLSARGYEQAAAKIARLLASVSVRAPAPHIGWP
jgi:carbohydrate esterase-like sialic acid-specific acetylesterase